MHFAETGVTHVQSNILHSRGYVLSHLEARRECAFCSLMGLRCACPENPSEPRALRLSSWEHLIAVGKRKFLVEATYTIKQLRGMDVYFAQSQPKQSLRFAFKQDAGFLDLQLAYGDFLGTTNRSVASWTVSESGDAGQDGKLVCSELPDWDSVSAVTTLLEVVTPEHSIENCGPVKVKTESRYGCATTKRVSTTCDQCGKEFVKANHLRRHVAALHEGKRPYECRECNLSFTQRGNLIRHRETVHDGRRRYSCEICLVAFANSSNLKRHVLRQHARATKAREVCIPAC
mmetsp:Transcript_54896/g.134553  ORF Transcript_54896/g.134553 Transcript_54896/m.134553 type:complete len:289 (+) Transcript_54896:337-1203(+)